MKNMRIILFSNPPLALPILEELERANILPTLLVTMPDSQGRRGSGTIPAVTKEWAMERDIDCLQPESIDDEILQDILFNSEWDLGIVASYGHIIPSNILSLPKHGFLNIHPSLLPKYRGASPIRSIILKNDKDAVGVTIISMDEKMDHGPIVAQAKVEMEEWPLKATLLEDLLAREGGKLLAEIIPEWSEGKIVPVEQEHSKASFTTKLAKEDGLLNLSDNAYQNYLKFCALEGWPGVYFFENRNSKQVRIKITDAKFVHTKGSAPDVGEFRVLRITPEGKREMLYRDFKTN
jgi:methionyl-tRNA formyltransferase